MGGVTDEQPLPDALPFEDGPFEDEQPIVPMLDLSAHEDPVETGAGPANEVEPPRLRMVGGILLLFAALVVVVALVLPLYHLGVSLGDPVRNLNGDPIGNDYVINAWGLVQQGAPSSGVAQLLNVLVGDTPMWGIPLVFVALLLAAAGSVALWRPTVRYVPGAVLAATALLVGCFAMLAEFVVTAVDPARVDGAVIGAIGPGFWLLVFAVVLALGGLAAALLGRPAQPALAQPEREEPPTPPMGFPALR